MGYDKTVANKIKINNEYFCGSQASIFIGDIWVDDICDWQYQMNYSAAPIYGYGEQLYSHVAEGKLLVQGSFTINFKEPNYLWAILESQRYATTAELESKMMTQELNKYDSPWTNGNEVNAAVGKRHKLETFFSARNPSKIEATIKKGRYEKVDKLNTEEIDFKKSTFDITLGYGSKLGPNSPGEKILGVKLIGRAKPIMCDGTPIREQYNFFARNVI